MKGPVFGQFPEEATSQIPPEIKETIKEQSGVSTGNCTTSVESYDHSGITALVSGLSKETGVPVPALVNTFGHFLFGQFAEKYNTFISETNTCFDFLEKVNVYLHMELCKQYPAADLPTIETRRPSDDELLLTYHSHRYMGDLAEGLLQAAVQYYGETVMIFRHPADYTPKNVINFTLRRTEALHESRGSSETP